MKEKDLKASLKDVKSVYVVAGADGFLCHRALFTLKNFLCPNFPDLNIVNVTADNLDIKTLFNDLKVCPFGDQYRLIIVSDLKLKKNVGKTASEFFDKVSEYALKPDFTTVLVIFNSGDGAAPTIKGAENVDCGYLSEPEIFDFINARLSGSGVSIESAALSKLVKYCGGDLTRIVCELDKLSAFVMSGEIKVEMVEKMVFKDTDFQVFEISQAISRGDKNLALEILTDLMSREKSVFPLLSPIYNNYKRALFVSINRNLSDLELSKLLQVKEFAVKMLRTQTKVFSARELKKIVDGLADLDKNIKQGKMREDVGLILNILNILMIRDKQC